MNKMLAECAIKMNDPIVLWCDKKSCIAIAKNPVLNFIRDLVTEKKIEVKYCNTDIQMANIFTKSLII